LVGAGLLGKSFYLLLRVNIGLQPDHLVTFGVAAPAAGYGKDEQSIALQHQVMSRIGNLPGVESVGLVSQIPVSGNFNTTWIRVLGRPFHGEHNEVPERQVSSGYFAAVKAKHPVNGKRVYVFGHSAGAIFGLYMAVMESEYFAAVGVHAGALQEDSYRFMEQAPRKIPIAIWVGTRDSFFALDVVRGTRDALNARGFQAQLREMRGHDHNYYAVSREVNKAVWDFLRANQLTSDPKWQQYSK